MRLAGFILKIIVSPILLALLLITYIYWAVHKWGCFIIYGGEWITYHTFDERKTILDIYTELKKVTNKDLL